jgi:hypothetical protein
MVMAFATSLYMSCQGKAVYKESTYEVKCMLRMSEVLVM